MVKDSGWSHLPTRERNALYVNGEVAARVVDEEIDEANARIRFGAVAIAESFQSGADFEFRNWRLKFLSAEVEAPEKRPGEERYSFRSASFAIVGQRAAR
jgi:hypothetical protein